jgi:hypothetical protein
MGSRNIEILLNKVEKPPGGGGDAAQRAKTGPLLGPEEATGKAPAFLLCQLIEKIQPKNPGRPGTSPFPGGRGENLREYLDKDGDKCFINRLEKVMALRKILNETHLSTQ